MQNEKILRKPLTKKKKCAKRRDRACFFAFLLPPFSLVFGLQGALQDKGLRQRDRLFCSLICC